MTTTDTAALMAKIGHLELVIASREASLTEEIALSGRYVTLNHDLRDQLDATEARLRVATEALRECRRAISNGAYEPRRNVREIVDTALAALDQPYGQSPKSG